MPDSKGGDDLGVFDDLLKKKEGERATSQPLIAEPPPAPVPQASPSAAPIAAPSDAVDDEGWARSRLWSAEPPAPEIAAAAPIAVAAEAAPAPAAAEVVPAPAAADVVPAPAAASSWSDDLVPAARSSRLPVPPAVRLSGVPLPPPPPSSRLPPPPSRLSSVPKLAPPPTVGSVGPPVSSLAPGSLAPPVLTSSAFTSPLPSAPLPPPTREPVAALTSAPAIASETVGAPAPRRIVSKQTIVIAATLAAGIVLGFVVRGSGGSAPGNPKATLKAAAGQPGVKLIVDGREVGLLPREVAGLSPGEHLISLEGDRYASTKKALIFGPNQVKELDPEPLKVVRGAATFDVKTPGATLVLVTADERRELSDYSSPIEVDATKSWTLEASKPGYETLRVPVNFGDQPTKTFLVTLGESSKAPSEPPKAPAPEPPPQPAKIAESTPATHKVSSPEVPKAEPPKLQAPAGTCKLNINSIPVSKVLLDGKPIGLTPKVGVVVPAGSHTVVFVGEKGRKSASSTCQAGETKAVSTHL